MKRYTKIIFSFLLFLFLLPNFGWGYTLRYKEQLWNLYHQQLYMYPIDIAENIHWLEQTLRADFVNPLWALAKINNEQEWQKYKNLFLMHINLKLAELYLQWGAKHTKFEAYFFNAPWRDANLTSLGKAEELLSYAIVYWEEAEKFAIEANKSVWINLEEVQYWEDELYRIINNELNYQRIIERHLERISDVKTKFEIMDQNTY